MQLGIAEQPLDRRPRPSIADSPEGLHRRLPHVLARFSEQRDERRRSRRVAMVAKRVRRRLPDTAIGIAEQRLQRGCNRRRTVLHQRPGGAGADRARRRGQPIDERLRGALIALRVPQRFDSNARHAARRIRALRNPRGDGIRRRCQCLVAARAGAVERHDAGRVRFVSEFRRSRSLLVLLRLERERRHREADRHRGCREQAPCRHDGDSMTE
jgi:hypothetical protein